jgi:transglutaminase-like putative cysteine protease
MSAPATEIVPLPEIPAERPGVARLTWVVVALAAVLVPQALHQPPAIIAFAVALGAWRLLAERRGWALPRPAVRAFAALVGMLGVWATFRTINGPEAGTALLIVMMALKLTETTTVRDCIVLVMLGWFVVLGEFLYTQDLWIAAWELGASWLLVAVLLSVSHPGVAFAPRAALAASGRYLALALPLLVAMFVLFPRVPGPLWGAPGGRGDAVSGLGDSMEPGAISNLIQSDEVAFRVRFLEGQPPAARYWRGPTLHRFDGRRWEQSWFKPDAAAELEPGGVPVRYEVTLEAHDQPWLFALEMPLDRPRGVELRYDFGLVDPKLVRERRVYTVRSDLRTLAGRGQPARRLRFDLQLPDRGGARARALAAEWRAAGGDALDIAMRALAMFREQEFSYTLRPPRLGPEPIDEFLFGTRRGFCEHYASSFVYLMRAAGVPARVVTGYLGGELNPINDVWVVRQSDAHAWAEVWSEERGWVRVDPTAAVAPDRIERGLEGALAGDELLPGAFLRSSDLLLRLRNSWDAVDDAWNRFFIGYGPDLQRELALLVGLGPDWQTLASALIVAVAVLMLALTAWLVRSHRPRPPDAARREWDRFRALLARAGVGDEPGEGPRDFAARAAAALPARRAAIEGVTEAYLAARYGRAGAAGLPALRAALRRFKAAA